MPDPVVSSQLAVGKVTLVSLPAYNLMAWSGTDAEHSVNLATSSGLNFPSASTGLAGAADPALGGPAVAMLPSTDAAYVAWVGSSGRICVTKATAGPVAAGATIPTWSCSSTVWTIANSTPRSAPAAALGLQNGHLVLNLVWQDGGAGSMVLAQLLLGDEANSLAFCSLGRSCVGTPSLSTGAGGSYLAWSSGPSSDGLYTLNLAVDPRGGVNFDVDAALSYAGTACEYGMAYVPLGPGHGYAVYTGSSGVRATQVGRNQSGDWVVNTVNGTAVTIAAAPAAGPANASRVQTVVDGTVKSAVAVVWPGTPDGGPPGSIMIGSFPPVVAPIPVVQYVIA